jgi:hypothetical protein
VSLQTLKTLAMILEKKDKPASALDILNELGDELVAQMRPEVTRVQLHVPV